MENETFKKMFKNFTYFFIIISILAGIDGLSKYICSKLDIENVGTIAFILLIILAFCYYKVHEFEEKEKEEFNRKNHNLVYLVNLINQMDFSKCKIIKNIKFYELGFGFTFEFNNSESLTVNENQLYLPFLIDEKCLQDLDEYLSNNLDKLNQNELTKKYLILDFFKNYTH